MLDVANYTKSMTEAMNYIPYPVPLLKWCLVQFWLETYKIHLQKSHAQLGPGDMPHNQCGYSFPALEIREYSWL